MNHRQDEYQESGRDGFSLQVPIGGLMFEIDFYSTFLQSAGSVVPNAHNHAFFEVHYVMDGAGIIQFDAEELRLAKHDLCIIAPTVFHAPKVIPGVCSDKSCFKFTYRILGENRETDGGAESKIISRRLDGITYLLINHMSECGFWLDQIKKELAERSLGYRMNIQWLFSLLLMDLFRRLPQNLSGDTERAADRKSLPPAGVEERHAVIEQFIDRQYMRSASLSVLARQLNLSQRQTEREVNRLFGRPFRQLLLQKRLAVAKDRLKNTTLTIQALSESLGYHSPGKFCHAFKAKTGFTPEEYRKNARQNQSGRGAHDRL
ncbi:MAG: AraC family transcriptional regulator [Clostridiaceae bacterium]|nr:AraC family transcriptional regulator [Clostridiaceae bacterium]